MFRAEAEGTSATVEGDVHEEEKDPGLDLPPELEYSGCPEGASLLLR